MESFNENTFEKGIGQKVHFIQDNQSYSSKGVLRGLVLSGGGAPTLGLAPTLQHMLATPCQVFNPLRAIPIKIQPGWQQMVVEQGHIFAPALGLALRKSGDHADGQV